MSVMTRVFIRCGNLPPHLWYSLARQCKSRASGKLGKASGPIILLGDTLLICQCPNKAQPYGI